MINYVDATDEIYDLFLKGFEKPAENLLGYVPEIYWRNKERADKPASDKFWCRVTVYTELEEQANISVANAGAYAKRWTTSGIVMIQLFCPRAVKNSDKLGQQLSNIIKLCYRGKTTDGGIWFRNARINDGLEPEELFYRFNIVADFEYDELTT